MSDELYRKVAAFQHEHEPVGFTLDDVRRLVNAFADETEWTAGCYAPENAAILSPFTKLLEGGDRG